MSIHTSDRRSFERHIAFARPTIVLLSLLALLEWPGTKPGSRALVFIVTYFFLVHLIIVAERILESRNWLFPLVLDLIALAVFLYLSPPQVTLCFPYLFVSYATGSRWSIRPAAFLLRVLSLALVC